MTQITKIYKIATQAQAVAGTEDTQIMTPLKVKQSIIANSVPSGTIKDYIFVSPTGSNTPGAGDGTMGKPYQTLEKGVLQATSGQTVFAMAGTYTPTSNLMKSGVSWYFSDDTIINASATSFTLFNSSSTMQVNIDGFLIYSGQGAFVNLGNSSGVVHNIKVKSATSTAVNCLTVSGSVAHNVTIEGYYQSSGGYALYIYGQDSIWNFNNAEFKSTFSDAINTYSNHRYYFSGTIIAATTTAAAYGFNAGNNYMCGNLYFKNQISNLYLLTSGISNKGLQIDGNFYGISLYIRDLITVRGVYLSCTFNCSAPDTISTTALIGNFRLCTFTSARILNVYGDVVNPVFVSNTGTINFFSQLHLQGYGCSITSGTVILHAGAWLAGQSPSIPFFSISSTAKLILKGLISSPAEYNYPLFANNGATLELAGATILHNMLYSASYPIQTTGTSKLVVSQTSRVVATSVDVLYPIKIISGTLALYNYADLFVNKAIFGVPTRMIIGGSDIVIDTNVE